MIDKNQCMPYSLIVALNEKIKNLQRFRTGGSACGPTSSSFHFDEQAGLPDSPQCFDRDRLLARFYSIINV